MTQNDVEVAIDPAHDGQHATLQNGGNQKQDNAVVSGLVSTGHCSIATNNLLQLVTVLHFCAREAHTCECFS